MTIKCPACGCTARAPKAACPACGLVYAKHSPVVAEQRAALRLEAEARLVRGRIAHARWGRLGAWLAPVWRVIRLLIGAAGGALIFGGYLLLFAAVVLVLLKLAF